MDHCVASDDRAQAGFTLVELLTVVTLTAILLTLGAGALRHFSLVQALEGAADEIESQLRQAHARSTSESIPRIYGARFRVGSSEWSIVQYNPVADTCILDSRLQFGGGMFSLPVVVSAAAFNGENDGVTRCTSSGTAAGWAQAGDEFVFFYARGSATPGSVTVRQPTLGRTRTIAVTAVTGRVERQ